MRHELIEYIDNNREHIFDPDPKLEKFRGYLKEAYPKTKKSPRIHFLDEYKPYDKPISPLRVVNYKVKPKGIPKALPSLKKRKSPSLDELVAILQTLKK